MRPPATNKNKQTKIDNIDLTLRACLPGLQRSWQASSVCMHARALLAPALLAFRALLYE